MAIHPHVQRSPDLDTVNILMMFKWAHATYTVAHCAKIMLHNKTTTETMYILTQSSPTPSNSVTGHIDYIVHCELYGLPYDKTG